MNDSSRKDIWIGIGFFVLILLFWFTGGFSGDRSLSTPIVPLGVDTSSSISQGTAKRDGEPAWPLRNAGTRQTTQTETDATEKEELRGVEAEIRRLERSGETSPYAGLVILSKRASGPKNRDVNREYIEMSASRDNTELIPITGWRLESPVSGRSIAIPEASYLPRSGEKNIDQPVWLSPGERAFIITGRSPIGISFRNNICAGYFTQFQRFEPFLSRQCPDPEDDILFYDEDLSIFNDNVCMDFVDRIGRCKVVTKLPPELSNSCGVAIIGELNYNSCVDNHKDDGNFIEDEWYIYLKREFELWRDKRELIVLFDQDKKIVDSFSY